MKWYYIWSQKYEMFHHILKNDLERNPNIEVNDIFVEQSEFSNTIKKNEKMHFLQGHTLKQRKLIEILKNNELLNEYIIFSDADLLVKTYDLYDYLKIYENNDMTFIREFEGSQIYNYGMLMIKCTKKTLVFHENVLKRIEDEGGLDQTIINEEIAKEKNNDLKIGYFSIPQIVNSHTMILKYDYDCKIIQMLSSNITSNRNENILEKLFTLTYYKEESEIKKYIPEELWNNLIYLINILNINPKHPLLKYKIS